MGMLAFCRDPSAFGALLLEAPPLPDADADADDAPEPNASFRNCSLFIVAAQESENLQLLGDNYARGCLLRSLFLSIGNPFFSGPRPL